ncbi:hypothetical protein U6A24_23145 [Aquimarina gracilis]|uniref:Natural product n=1 Tax=Aquimarina gracilis TaxID=874422 RepID=A0ABU6A2L3_9FLAO|nr:hypothetical protein [Aquimarina gracilis]MEB3348386.1 hypothetical protein [Aquimarina gracilis]
MKKFKLKIDDFKEMELSKEQLEFVKGTDYSGPTEWSGANGGGSDYCWDGACTLQNNGALA